MVDQLASELVQRELNVAVFRMSRSFASIQNVVEQLESRVEELNHTLLAQTAALEECNADCDGLRSKLALKNEQVVVARGALLCRRLFRMHFTWTRLLLGLSLLRCAFLMHRLRCIGQRFRVIPRDSQGRDSGTTLVRLHANSAILLTR